MRAWVMSVLVVLGSGLSGCLSDVPDAGVDPDHVAKPVTQWVMDAAGNLLGPDAYGGDLPAFDLVHITDRISGEPTVGVTRQGAVFYASIDFDVAEVEGEGTLPSTVFYRSTDGGESWDDKSPNIAGVRTHPESGDPYVYVDPTTGRVYAMDMSPVIFCQRISWSDDEGETWTWRELACIPGANDHPSLFAGPATPFTNTAVYPNHLYQCTNQVTDTICYHSPDGGLTWSTGAPVFLGYEPSKAEVNTEDPPMGAAEGALEGLCGGLSGHGHASWADGTIYLGREWCGEARVGISRDGGLTWESVLIADGEYHAPGTGPSGHDVSIGTDRAGNAYAFWLGDYARSAFLSVSRDRGATWSEPINVTAPNVSAVRFPSLVAGDEGRIAFLYIGSETPSGWAVDDLRDGCVDPAKPYCYPDGEAYNRTTWNAYIGMSLNAHTEDPVFATVLGNPVEEPLKRGGCVDRCFGDRGGMYDFLDIDMDPMTGQVWAALVDVCTAECDGPGYGKFNANETAMGATARMIGGTSLLDEPIEAR